jgi:hypothetical protein
MAVNAAASRVSDHDPRALIGIAEEVVVRAKAALMQPLKLPRTT